MANGTAVQFGAGNIGRGFLAQLFRESGLEVVFVDVAGPIVEALNTRRAYPIQIVGPHPEPLIIDSVRAIHGQDLKRVAEAVAAATILCTAVGANALPHVAPGLAAGLLARRRARGAPINILLCENLHDAAGRLRAAVAAHLPEAEREDVLAHTGFVQAVVSRMVPFQTDSDRAADPLAIRVEAYKRLPIDAAAMVPPLPRIVGVEPVANFTAHVERKLYTHNGAHAILGYLGHQAGYTYGYEALLDAHVRATLQSALEETGCALIARHHFDPDEHRAHVEDLLARFANKSLGDTCRRLARDPLRKLAPDDRLVGAARLCEAYGITPRALATGIAAALRYVDPDDPSACELQRLLQTEGVEATLQQVCGIQPDEPLAKQIKMEMKKLGN